MKDSIDNVAYFIPIGKLEGMLDNLEWNTGKFQYTIFKDGYANLCVAASLELQISYTGFQNKTVIRTFVGACNFSLSSIEPNTHFLATAKSECIKNAASDMGRYFGRGLNDGIIPSIKSLERKSVKSKPDSKIMKQFLLAIEKGDIATTTMLSNIYDIKTETNVEES
jgi:hypothetical protein